MAYQITIHGAPVQIATLYRRDIPGEGGPALIEIEIAVMVRGRLPNRHFIQLTTQEPLRVGLPMAGAELVLFGMITNHQQINSGSGEGAMFRHDVTIREVPESALRREAAQREAERQAAADRPAPIAPPAAWTDDDEEERLTAAGTGPRVAVRTSASTWGTAIQQMKNPAAARATLADEPLAFTEMAGVEAVLVNLRVEALIEQLRAANLISGTAVDQSYQRLIHARFLTDATPVVGEHAAKRAARQLMGPEE